ncbi:MAG: hypothetical protein M1831_007293 [Alyxoria varia]|nr:MAG: hypothetical protein M1831_007293 [Alyxoria varia]
MDTSISLIGAFEDHEYERQVLQLDNGQNENDLERQREQDAGTLGVDTGPIVHIQSNHDPTDPTAASSYDSIHDYSSTSSINTFRRSLSNESRRTCSTGVTLPSRLSKESNLVLPLSPLTPHDEHKPSSFSRPPPLRVHDYGPASPTSLTSPTPSLRLEPTKSSPPLATPRRFASRLGLNRLARLKRPITSYPRSETPTCRLCPFTSSQPELVYRLNCNHSLCANHLSALVLDTKKGRESQRLKCCNESIPSIAAHSIIEKNNRERPAVSQPAPAPQDLQFLSPVVIPSSPPPSRGGDDVVSQSHRGRSQSRHRSRHNSLMFFPADHLAKNLDRAMAHPEFTRMRIQQHGERDRFLSFRSEKECSLRAQQQKEMGALQDTQEQHRRDLSDKHPQELANLEDTHITAELELLEHHSLESRNCLTALRHMEGYCKGGQDPTGTERVVTLQDRVKLERQYWRWKNLERKQASAINVMREQQARQLKTRSLKQVNELSALQEAQEKGMRELEDTHAREVEDLRWRFEQRRCRLVGRWDLATGTWKARCETLSQDGDEHGKVPYPVLPVEWPA